MAFMIYLSSQKHLHAVCHIIRAVILLPPFFLFALFGMNSLFVNNVLPPQHVSIFVKYFFVIRSPLTVIIVSEKFALELCRWSEKFCEGADVFILDLTYQDLIVRKLWRQMSSSSSTCGPLWKWLMQLIQCHIMFFSFCGVLNRRFCHRFSEITSFLLKLAALWFEVPLKFSCCCFVFSLSTF